MLFYRVGKESQADFDMFRPEAKASTPNQNHFFNLKPSKRNPKTKSKSSGYHHPSTLKCNTEALSGLIQGVAKVRIQGAGLRALAK